MNVSPARPWLMSGALLFVSVCSLQAQLVVKLSPQTVAEFEHYANKVEAQLNERWSAGKNFLVLDGSPEEKKKVLAGELFIKSMSGDHPVAVTDGLIHDWLGAVFIPHATPENVVSILEDFNRHKDIYPEVTQSKTLGRSGSTVTGYWRLEQKAGIVPIILNVTEEATYKQVSQGKWKGLTYAKKIIETDTGLFSRGKKFPLGEGHGYLWRLYGYWSLEAAQGGTLAECRTLSLSRDIPQGLNWAVAPYVEKQPRTSLASLLTNTRKAAE
ncbi:MAG TPA: hypothetical protein VN633_08265 [Bryobacteraceae bacterium]|nr:hypothetical protein [Bryobacteraceae bacterium]